MLIVMQTMNIIILGRLDLEIKDYKPIYEVKIRCNDDKVIGVGFYCIHPPPPFIFPVVGFGKRNP